MLFLSNHLLNNNLIAGTSEEPVFSPVAIHIKNIYNLLFIPKENIVDFI